MEIHKAGFNVVFQYCETPILQSFEIDRPTTCTMVAFPSPNTNLSGRVANLKIRVSLKL